MRREYLLPLVLFAAGCNRNPPHAGGPSAPAGPAVSVVKPQQKAIRRVVEQPGLVRAFEETDLFAKLPGYVKAISADPDKKDRPPHDRFLDIGSRVKAGQVMVELALPELEEEARQKAAAVTQAGAEIEQAKKALVAAEAAVGSAQAQVAEAKAGLERAQALYDRWQGEFARIGGLVEGGVITSENKEETRNQFRSASAAREEATAKVASATAAVRKAEADRGKAGADVTASAAKLEYARADERRVGALLGYATLSAPYDGVVTRRAVDTGDFLQPGGPRAVFAVARVDPVRVVVQVPEADAELVHPGLPVKVALQALRGPDRSGTVTRTSWALEPGSRTLRTEIDLPNADGAVRPGMYAYSRVTAELPAAWTVPAAAIGKAGDDYAFYLAEGGKAVRVPVQVGRGDGQFTQVRRYKKPGAAEWTDVTGTESIATPAAALTDGQALP
jgi:multidrug efflux pump subunit AcrA (membrane-fusion protein)